MSVPPQDPGSRAGVPWSRIPGRTAEAPGDWPVPRHPSRNRMLAWRTGAVVACLVVVGLALYYWTQDDGRPAPVMRTVATGSAIGVAVVAATLAWRTGSSPYYGASEHNHIRVRGAARRRMTSARRALRAGTLSADDLPAARAWVVENRSSVRSQIWMGFVWAPQLPRNTGEDWGFSVFLYVAVAFWLGIFGYVLLYERRLRVAESRLAPGVPDGT